MKERCPEGGTHWICKPCETMNHNSRDYCLSCGGIRKKVQLTDAKKLNELRTLFYGRRFNET